MRLADNDRYREYFGRSAAAPRSQPARFRPAAGGPRNGQADRRRALDGSAGSLPNRSPSRQNLNSSSGSLRTLHMTPVELFVQYELPVRRAAKDDKKATRQQSRIIVGGSRPGPHRARDRKSAPVAGSDERLLVQPLQRFRGQGTLPSVDGRVRGRGNQAAHAVAASAICWARRQSIRRCCSPISTTGRTRRPTRPARRDKFEGINENYARELMELHTLGVNGGYTQTDVIALAHILTGWGIVRGGNGMQQRAQFGGGMFQPRGFGFGPYFGFRPWRQRREAAAMPGGVRTPYGFFFDPSRHDSKRPNGYGPPSSRGHQRSRRVRKRSICSRATPRRRII